jgi:hypothetical protein
MSVRIITCPQWKAAQPRAPIQMCPQASRIIFHHTAGHHPELSLPANVESVAESVAYARQIQAFHMNVNGWNDSGHNFLVCRNGVVLQGRWRTVSAIQAGAMVVSAHCPGQNTQIGVEHEHAGTEPITAAQLEASAQLQAWVAARYGLGKVLPVHPHSEFFATACPANLADQIPAIVRRAQAILDAGLV